MRVRSLVIAVAVFVGLLLLIVAMRPGGGGFIRRLGVAIHGPR